MLKLTLKSGDFIMIGDSIKVVYAGGGGNNAHILVEAPRDMNVARNKAMEIHGTLPESQASVKHYKDKEISPEAKEKIRAILLEERKKAKKAEQELLAKR